MQAYAHANPMRSEYKDCHSQLTCLNRCWSFSHIHNIRCVQHSKADDNSALIGPLCLGTKHVAGLAVEHLLLSVSATSHMVSLQRN